MKIRNKNFLSILVAVLFVTCVSTQAQTKVSLDKADTSATGLYPLQDLRPGMKGIARTVFSGTEPEEFQLEILGVLDGFAGPRQSTIIARLSGPNVARTGVFAGMSGSPVFIDNK